MKELVFKCLNCGTILHGVQPLAAHIRVNYWKQLSCEVHCPDGILMVPAQRRNLFEMNKQVLCSLCGKECVGKKTLERHEYSIHGIRPAKIYDCQLCSFSSLEATKLRRHMNCIHSENRTRSEICDLCGKAFYNRGYLQSHIQVVHSKQKERFKCSFCSLSFGQRKDIVRHENLHAGIKKHKCSYCSTFFATPYTLKVHERIHTGDKPYGCTICKASFAQKNSLDVHMKKHGIKKPAIPNSVKRGKAAFIPELARQKARDLSRHEDPQADIEPLLALQKVKQEQQQLLHMQRLEKE